MNRILLARPSHSELSLPRRPPRRRSLKPPRRFRKYQGGFLMNPYRFGGGGGGGGTAWTTTATQTHNSNSGGWTSYTIRQAIPTSALAAGFKVRITLKAPAATSIAIGAAYFQTSTGGAYPTNFSTTPIQVLFSGVATTTIAAGASVVTDDITIALTGSDMCVLTIYFTGASSISVNNTGTATGWSAIYTPGNRASTVSEGTSGSSLGTPFSAIITKIEVWT